MYSRTFRAALLTLALLSVSTSAAAQDIPSSCNVYERLAVQIEQVTPGHVRFRENVEITCETFKFFADHVELFTDDDRLIATGNVLFTTPDTRITASKVEFDLKNKTGVFYEATGSSRVKPDVGARSMFGTQEADMHFRGETLEKLGERKYRLTNGGFTTCLQPTPRWEFTSGSVTINIDDYAIARNTVFRVKGVPLLYLPIIYYPLQEDNRATGFLLPGYGNSNFRGQTIRNAFFWAINRSSDLTLEHNFFSKTGQAYSSEFRYVLAPGSQGNVFASLLDEHESVTVFPDGSSVPRPAARTLQLRGDLVQELPGRFRLGARADYTSDITTRQLYDQNVFNATNPSSTISANVSGAVAGWQVGGQFARTEIFYGDGTSAVTGSSPRVTLSRAEQRIPGLPVYWGVAGEGVGILSEHRGLTDTIERNRMRLDLAPTLRAPLSKLAWLQATASLAWRSTWWSESLDASNVPVDEPIVRNYFELQTNLVGPVFGRIFNTPARRYAQRWKHVVEPSLTLARTSEVDRESVYDRIVRGHDATDVVVGGVTRVRYALTNRLYAKRGEGPLGVAREIATFTIEQTYHTDALSAANDQYYRNTFTNELPPSKFTPIVFSLRASPVEGSFTEFVADYDTQFNAVRQFRATTSFKVREYLDLRAGWSQQRLIEGLPGFNDPLRNARALTGSANLRTQGNKYGGTYEFHYDVVRSAFINQRVVASYNAQCCGIGLDYQTFNIPTFAGRRGHLDRRFNLSFTLAGIGSFSDFFGAFGVDPYRR